jgi:hypothetical protein
MNSSIFQEKVSYLNGYLVGVSELCHGLNYVPIYRAISCLVLTDDVFADVQSQISLTTLPFDECNRCNNFEGIDDWEQELKESLNKWIFNLILSRDIVDSDVYLHFKEKIEIKIIYFIKDNLVDDELRVWRFQVNQGFCYTYGFDNEAYAFKSKNNLFVVNFGWAD